MTMRLKINGGPGQPPDHCPLAKCGRGELRRVPTIRTRCKYIPVSSVATSLSLTVLIVSTRPSSDALLRSSSETIALSAPAEPRGCSTLFQDCARQEVEPKPPWMGLRRVLKQGTTPPWRSLQITKLKPKRSLYPTISPFSLNLNPRDE